MEIKTGVSLQTKQTLSQVQMESLNVLSMSMTELREFLQNEEIENPLVEYSSGGGGSQIPVTYRETERCYGSRSLEDADQPDLYQAENGPESVENLVMMQLSWEKMGEDDRKVVDFCINSLEQSGYLPIPPEEIAKKLGLKKDQVEQVLSGLKLLEPRGIFASGLEECLLLQIQGMEQEEALKRVIKDHLQDVAEGRISSISRDLKLSSAEVRKLIHIIKELNPRPLNGYGEAEAQYILPDIILTCQNGQWNMELNDKWTGNVQINEFYVHMMETAQDEELKSYFEEKLRRARFIMNAVDQRRRTLLGITEGILKRQPGYLLGTEHLKPMTLEELAEELGVHKSTVSRAIRDKYLLAPGGCFLLRDLFTSGIASGDGKTDEVSRTAVKAKLRELVEAEDKGRPYSDEQLARLLERDGMPVSRRTVAKYRMELGLGSAFQRREE